MDLSEYSLKWSNHGSSLAAASSHLLEDGALADVTLSAEGQQLQAHKFILAVSSPYFKQILINNPCQHPVIILRDVPALDVQYLLLFIYQGHVNVPHSCLSRFIELAKALEIVGLAQVDPSSDTLQDISDGQPRKRRRMSDEVACEERLSPGLQLKTEIQDMLEVKLETGEAASSSPEPIPKCTATDDCGHPAPAVLPAQRQQTAVGSDVGRQILPKPDCLDENLYSNHNMRLRIPSNLQPEFPLDPSCLKLPFPCPFCDKAYMSWGFRRRHIKVCHSLPSQLPCKWCPAILTSSLQWQVLYASGALLSSPRPCSGRYCMLVVPCYPHLVPAVAGTVC
ncbi:BTB/POZ domain [Trinorchestia longiramus]|nr:BTB/POZ domain [Trinorchestia longiramus]